MNIFPDVPSPVAEMSRATLEWDRLLELLAGYATASVTKVWLLMLVPSRDRDWITAELLLTQELKGVLDAGGRPSLAGLFDSDSLLDKSRIEGAILDAEELRALNLLAGDIARWHAQMGAADGEAAERIAALRELSAPLEGNALGRLVESFDRRMLPDGTLTDEASPNLRRIRREIERQGKAIEDGLRQTLRRLSDSGSAQEDLITIRGERFVIPVKAEWKRRVPGVVHGASSSGQTVYLEPLETIEANNELVRLLDEEQAEIQRIFQSMTREIAAQSSYIAAGTRILAHVDALLARAQFARAYNGVTPRFTTDADALLHLSKARHPLLERRLRASGGALVPLSVELRGDARQLIISGPNTGGKTVALKTVGLLSMMAQSAIPVPAEEAVLPIFDAFLADIGDAQSIEQNLSTFSSHIVNLNRLAEEADSCSLVLLDELGSATDPEEGAALAVSIAEFFLRSGAWSIISTHHTSLKVYAAQTSGVLNAAVGFDESTLAPTYELRLGVPGASAGINIAQRLGLRASVVQGARARLSRQTEDIARFLDALHAQLTTVAAEREQLRLREADVARERNRLEVEGLKEWRAKVRELEGQLQSLMKDFEFRMRETISAVSDKAEQSKLAKEAERRVARMRREFSEQFNATAVAQHTGAHRGDAAAQPHVVRHVATGDTVKLKSLGKSGVVLRQVDDKFIEVAIGPMKMKVAREDVSEVERASPARTSPVEAARRRGINVSVSSANEDMRSEINVIGQSVDQASEEVERFLDQAFLAGLPRVRIVHGIGMGVLRRALRAMLGQHPHVALVAEASPAEGGGGATIVDLRQ